MTAVQPSPSCPNPLPSFSPGHIGALLGCTAVALLLTGCGLGTPAASSAAPAPLVLNGRVHGGQQPIAGSQIFLYQVGNTGNASASTSLLTTPVFTAADGSFGITGDYTCPDAAAPVYLVSAGGDPGVGSPNPAAMLVAALGTCANLLANAANIYVNINELTTVAAAWVIAPFATDSAHIGTTSTNRQGLKHAFDNTALLADSSTGNLTATDATRTFESAKLISLANTIAACVNTAAGSGPCTALFTAATPPGGTAPADVFAAALNIVQNPAANVTDIFNVADPTPPYGGGLTSPPTDWTLSSTTLPPAGSCFTGLSVDSTGGVWAIDPCANQLFGFNAQAQPLPGSPFAAGTLDNPSSILINAAGDIWIANPGVHRRGQVQPQAGFLTRFQGPGGASPGTLIPNGGSSTYTDPNMNEPGTLTARANGNFLLTNNGGSQAVIEFDSTGTVVNVSNGPSGTTGVTPDLNGGFWYMYSAGNTAGADHFQVNDYANPVTAACCTAIPYTGATDAAGNFWGVNDNTVSVISNGNTTLIDSQAIPGLSNASAIVVDAGGIVWPLADASLLPSGAVGFTAISTGTAAAGPGAATLGTVLSPTSGYGLDANILDPRGLSPDASGNLWVIDAAGGLVQFFGVTTPTATPLFPPPTAP